MGAVDDVIKLESSLLYARLGRVTEGGVIEGLEPVGAASVPELAAHSPIDIGLAVWPFPLTTEHRDIVSSLGYVPVAGYETAPEQRFFHLGKHIQLFFVEPGSEHWTNYLLIRDFLRHSGRARQSFSNRRDARPDEVQTTKETFFAALLKDAEAWWTGFHGFSPVERAARELSAFGHPWLFSSGWALDLFMECVSRVHHDVDVVVPRPAVPELRRYLIARGWKLVLPLEGRLEPWPLNSPKQPLLQVHAHRAGAFIDFLVSDVTADTWSYRRDPRITLPAERAFLHTRTGVPFLAPELVLLFKSKNTGSGERRQDQRDFDAVYPRLEATRRAWLRGALTATDPAHGWLERL